MIISRCFTCFEINVSDTKKDSIITGANIRIEKFEQCPDKLDLPNTFVGTRASQSGLNDITIEGRIKVGQTIVDPASVSF